VERLGVAEGNPVELDRVLLVGDGEKVTVGAPVIKGAKVVATSRGESKLDKVVVFRYKSKVRYHKKTGHRQPVTRLVIDRIEAGEGAPAGAKSEAKKRVRRSKKEVSESGS
jgi:large subunit ribosomal protein L21